MIRGKHLAWMLGTAVVVVLAFEQYKAKKAGN